MYSNSERNFYEITDYVYNKFLDDPYVHTVVFDPRNEADYQKKNIYPIVCIIPSDGELDDPNFDTFIYEIGIFDQRDLSNDDIKEKFYSNDNKIDTLNNTWAIGRRFVKGLQMKNNDLKIRINAITNMRKITLGDKNLLDGWYFTISLQVPNTMCGS